ncbi:hypothetical protein KR018_010801, partial [Drosophila ironensis]
MKSHRIAVLLALVALGTCSANPSLVSGPSKMFEIMSATSDVQRNNPALTGACFAYYNGVFDGIYKDYQVEHDSCQNEYNEGKDGVLKRYDPVVSDLSNSTSASCQALIECDSRNNSLDALNCYSAEATTKSKDVYSIASNASISAGALSQEIQQLSYTCDICTNSSARNYETRSGQAYIDFQNCLTGAVPVPDLTTTYAPQTSIDFSTQYTVEYSPNTNRP